MNQMHECGECRDTLLRPGNTNCAGCGMSVGLQLLHQGLAGEVPIFSIPACCAVVAVGAFPTSAYGAPVASSTFAGAAAFASGMASVVGMNNETTPVICWTGDGGTYDIGIAAVSAAAERNEDVLYICYDNEIYGNTGGQRSSATPAGVTTSTTPAGKSETKKDMLAIMAAHRIPYAATLSIAHRDDFLRKVRYARQVRGFRFLLLLSPCPTGWKSEPAESVDLINAAVRCGLFPLYEVFDGRRYRINQRPDGSDVAGYITHQRRYSGVKADVEPLRELIRDQWHILNGLEQAFPASAEEGSPASQMRHVPELVSGT